jgi:3-phenylpropionate/cinnamic acid dioxygenase small subunit
MDEAINTLLEKDRIIDRINALFINTDNRDWRGVRGCFADQVLFDMTSMAGGEPATLTPQQITDAWEQGLKDLKALHHQAGNYQVKINNDEADASCYGIALHYLPNPSNNNTRVFVGSYDFHLVRVNSGWRIDRFKFNLKFIEGNLELT